MAFSVVLEAVNGPAEIILMTLPVATIIGYIIMAFKIRSHLKLIAPQQQQINSIQLQNFHPGQEETPPPLTSHAMPAYLSSSLLDHRTVMVIMALMLALSPLLAVAAYQAGLEYGLHGAVRVMLTFVAHAILPGSFYITKRHLRITLWRELRPSCFN